MDRSNRKSLMLVAGVIVLAIITGISYVWFTAKTAVQEPVKTANYTVEKNGDRENIDFREKTQEIHGFVDNALKNDGVILANIHQEIRQKARQATDGDFIWDTRNVYVSVRNDVEETVIANLENALRQHGASVLDRVNDNYQGAKVIRLDIGIADEVDEETVKIVSDRIYIKTISAKLEENDNQKKGKLALLIDDFGYSREGIQQFRNIKCPLTFAVLPYHNYSREAAETGFADGRQIILHLPMEAVSAAVKQEEITVTIDMESAQIMAIVNKMLSQLPHVSGINNHQGSRAMTDPRTVRAVLAAARQNDVYFIDSRTNSRSIGYDTAQQLGISSAENQLFIDNKNDLQSIKEQLKKAADLALQNGQTLAIGHARKNTAAAIVQMLPELEQMGIEMVLVSSIIE